jgi:hypothetical protein
MSCPFILWTTQRTGGTELGDLLMDMSEHPCAGHEPFNWARDEPRRFQSLVQCWLEDRDDGALSKALVELLAQRYLIKHCYELFSMRFNLLLMEAATRAHYVHVHLVRRDETARLISKFIAETQGTWFGQYALRAYAEIAEGSRRLDPLPVAQIVAQYRHCRNSMEFIRASLRRSGFVFIETSYESLFIGSREQRLENLEKIFEVLGFEANEVARNHERIETTLLHRGQDTSSLRPFIPNLREVVVALAAAGCESGAEADKRLLLDELMKQLKQHADAGQWVFTENLNEEWPGFSFNFEPNSNVAFRIEAANMRFDNIYFGLKNEVAIHNKSLDEALSTSIGVADCSDKWPWCRHPSSSDPILPIDSNWADSEYIWQDIRNGILAAKIISTAERFRVVLGTFGYITVAPEEWAALHEVPTMDDRSGAGIPPP